VAIPELGDESNAKEENYGVPLKPFRKFPIWQRALVAFAGVGFNIGSAWLIYLIMLVSIGQPAFTTIVDSLPAANPIARDAGVLVGDKLLAIDSAKVSTPDDVVQYLEHRPSTPVVLHIDREGKMVDITAVTNPNGKVGMSLSVKGAGVYTPVQGNIVEIAGLATEKTWKLSCSMIDALGQMVQGVLHLSKPAPGRAEIGVKDMHGVLAVVAYGTEIFKQDWRQVFLFTIMISLDIAIINLVPWPALDGGHLALMALEAVRGKPMHERSQSEIFKWGFVSLLLLMAVIMFNDVRALMTGELTMKSSKKDKVKDSAPAPQQTSPGSSSTSSSTTAQPGSNETQAPAQSK
jgi:regulator of sigma E protease